MIYLYGASGHAKVIIEILELQNKAISGILDDDPNTPDILGYPVQRPFDSYPADSRMIISIGDNITRKRIAAGIQLDFETAIHPSAVISGRSPIGGGSVVMAHVVVNSCCTIGKHVILNTNCTVDHDCILHDFVHLSPQAALAGRVTVGEGTHIGIGACIIQGITIGKWATIGAGAVVIKDVPDYAVAVGNPAKVVKFNPQVK